MKHTPNIPFDIPLEPLERFEIEFAQFELYANAILVVRLDDELYFTEEKPVLFMQAVEKISKGVPLKMLLLMGAHTSVDSVSRDYFALEEHKKYISKCATVINSISQRLLGNFFLRINKPLIETKLFNDPQESWDWLVGERGEMGNFTEPISIGK